MSLPITGLNISVHHGYVYIGPEPFQGDAEASAARFERMKEITGELASTVLADWQQIFEPRVLAIAAHIQSFDFEAATLQEAARFIAGFEELMTEIWDIHMRVNIPPMNAVFGFEEMLSHVLGEEVLDDARRLLQGFPNKSLETGAALWALSRWIRADQALTAAVLAARVRGGQVEMEDVGAKAEFSRRWQQFLDTYGWRSDMFFEIGHKSWREDPSSPLSQLKRFIAREDAEDPYRTHAEQVADRTRLEREFAERLPEPVRPVFHALLPMAQQYVPIAEDHNFTIDQKFVMVTRDVFLRFGRKLVAAGLLREAEDVFYVLYDELCALADGPPNTDLKKLVRQRHQTRIAQGQLKPPPMLGTAPPADLPPDPLVTKFFGMGAKMSTDSRIVTGYPCSGGTVTGVARVIMSLDDADRLQPGEILVCQMTMPPWTPLFGFAGGVVADSGGPLSHCAIVAREYRIPCVAGTVVGTAVIRDGAHIRVDGSAGTVAILD